jgi:hypothetical protein
MYQFAAPRRASRRARVREVTVRFDAKPIDREASA